MMLWGEVELVGGATGRSSGMMEKGVGVRGLGDAGEESAGQNEQTTKQTSLIHQHIDIHNYNHCTNASNHVVSVMS